MIPTLRANGPADLLATIPVLIGEVPAHSVVIVIQRRGHTGALRFNLPADDSPKAFKGVATQTMGLLCKVTDVRSLYLAVYTDVSIESRLPHGHFMQVLLRQLRHGGFTVSDALCRAENGWGSYLDPDLPHGGYPLSELDEAESRMPAVSTPAGASADIPVAKAADSKRTRKALARYREILRNLKDTDDDPPELAPLGDLPRFAEESLEWEDAERDTNSTLLLFALQSPPVRDATMLQWAFGFEVGDACYGEDDWMVEQGAGASNERETLLARLIMGDGPQPDRSRIKRGIELLLALLARVDGIERRAPLCMLAWLSWALGRGTQAANFIDEARSIDPEYGMAELLDIMFARGTLPEWVFVAPDETVNAV